MLKRLSLILLLALAFSAPLQAAESSQSLPPYSTGFDESRDPFRDGAAAIELASQSNRRILIDLGGDWCVWCHKMDAFFDANPDLKQRLHQTFVLLKVNVSDGNPNSEFLKSFPKPLGYPHMYVSDKNGSVLWSQDTAEFLKDGHYNREAFRAFLIAGRLKMNKPDHSRLQLNRRQFVQLVSSSALLAPGLAWGDASTQANAQQANRDPAYQNLQDPWLTIAEVQQHLLPAGEQSPGAEQIGALRFLQTMLQAQNDPQETEFIHKGVGWLNQLANKQYQADFKRLEPAQREKLLRQVETSDAGARWLSSLMTYLVEALLSDPVYGGNKNRRGWQWLEHIPGFPTPSADKVYFKLGAHASSRRRTKA